MIRTISRGRYALDQESRSTGHSSEHIISVDGCCSITIYTSDGDSIAYSGPEAIIIRLAISCATNVVAASVVVIVARDMAPSEGWGCDTERTTMSYQVRFSFVLFCTRTAAVAILGSETQK